MKNNRNERNTRPRRRKLTLLVTLVIFVFFVLLVSMAISALFLLCMNFFGLLQPLSLVRLPVFLAFMLVVSLLVSILISSVAGNFSLRPLKRFVDATKEIGAGNFDVRVETRGPEEYNKLATSFNEMAKELGSIETLRNDFVSNISHEFKTPVVSIRGFAKLLKRGDLSQEQQEEYLDIIISESDRLTQLSSNVLLLSRVDSTDKLSDVAVFPLDEQLRRVILMLNESMDEKKIDLELQLEACTITSNEELLQQVWINLLGNAIKFTPEGGCVSVQMECNADQACVVVRDTGVGMEPEVMKHVFEKFYQGEESRSSQGNGLGLSLVKRIVQLCGGTVEVASEVGVGSTFTVTLPRRNVENQAKEK